MALRTHGVRVRSGPLTITALLDLPAGAAGPSGSKVHPASPSGSRSEPATAERPDAPPVPAGAAAVDAHGPGQPGTVERTDPPRVAFAIGRQVGHAVVRNRLRRRLRAICAELAGTSLAPGAYLVSARPAAAALSYSELRTDVQRALSRLNPGRDQGTKGPAPS